MAIKVLVDSSSCMTRDVAEAYHLRLVPLHLVWGKKEYADWVDMTPEEFYARLKTETETWPTTSGSVQGEFLNAFEELRGKFDGAVAVTLSPDTPSGGYQSALMAKEMAEAEGFAIEVVDSRTTVTALGLIATAAAQAAHGGASLEEVVKAAQSVIPKVNVFFNVGSITYLMKSGRVSEAEVDLKEDSYIITVKEGKITPFEKYPTREEARRRLRELLNEKARKDTPLHAGLFHAAAREDAEEFKNEIASQYNCAELWIGEAAPVGAIHLSPSTLGLAFYNG